MATLAAQILTDWQATRASKVQVDQSNAFDDDTSADTTYLTNHAAKAAALVASYLGDGPDSTDDEALAMGMDAMDISLNIARVGLTAETIEARRLLVQMLKDLRDARVSETATPVTYDVDGEAVTP